MRSLTPALVHWLRTRISRWRGGSGRNLFLFVDLSPSGKEKCFLEEDWLFGYERDLTLVVSLCLCGLILDETSNGFTTMESSSTLAHQSYFFFSFTFVVVTHYRTCPRTLRRIIAYLDSLLELNPLYTEPQLSYIDVKMSCSHTLENKKYEVLKLETVTETDKSLHYKSLLAKIVRGCSECREYPKVLSVDANTATHRPCAQLIATSSWT